MHFIKGLNHPEFAILLYEWNNKFIVKFELGPFEQVYKFSQLDFSSLEEFENMLHQEEFLRGISASFEQMKNNYQFGLDQS